MQDKIISEPGKQKQICSLLRKLGYSFKKNANESVDKKPAFFFFLLLKH